MRAPFFPVGTETWLANVNYITPSERHELNYGPINITYTSVHHPGTTYGYRIRINDKSILYVSDNECQYLNKAIRMKYGQFNKEERELYDAVQREEYESELDLIKGADILIHDAQYTKDDYVKKRGWGHSCYIMIRITTMRQSAKSITTPCRSSRTGVRTSSAILLQKAFRSTCPESGTVAPVVS
jgi:hypothetical protein